MTPTPEQTRACTVLHGVLARYADLPDAEWHFFMEHLRFRQFAAGEVLVRLGDLPGSFHFVVQGLVRAYFADAGGREFIKCFACEMDITGPLIPWRDGRQSDVVIEAIEPTDTLAFPATLLPILLGRHPAWARILHGFTEELARRSEGRTEELLSLTPEQRYRHFMVHAREIHDRVPLHQIANYLGITQVSLSRIRRRMRLIQG